MTGQREALSEAQLRVLCRKLLTELGFDSIFEPYELCRRLASHRGRRIVLEASQIRGVEGAGFGALLPLPDKDIIVFPVDVSPPWQGHIIYHEVVHLIRGHGHGGQLLCGSDADQAAEAEKAGSGQYYRRAEEWEAETGAVILAELAGRPGILIESENPRLSSAEQAYARAVGGRFQGRRL